MRNPAEPKLSKWPFLAGDVLLLSAAGLVYFQSKLPLGPWQIGFIVCCVGAGACIGIVPFLIEYMAQVKVAEAGALTTVTAQMQNLEHIATQIAGATGRWQNAQEEADKTAAAARMIADRMTAEVQAFTDFMQRMNDSEKSTLRLEAEKLRRAEGDWLQILVRVLDHIYALYVGAVRSGQPSVIEQVTSFQNACRDTARRVGLAPFSAEPTELFDAQRHQPLNGEGTPAEGAMISETIATGYTFQGRLLRPALVRLADEGETAASSPALGKNVGIQGSASGVGGETSGSPGASLPASVPPPPEPKGLQSHLPLGVAG